MKRRIGNGSRRAPLSPLLAVALSVAIGGCTHCPPNKSNPGVASPAPSGPETKDFLDHDDFAGKFIPRPGDTAVGGKAVYAGRIVFSNLPRSEVEKVLPTDLRLASNTSATPNVHPVALIFGHQTGTAWVLPGGFDPDVGPDYSELILLIPFVQSHNGTQWHNYVVRIYLDDLGALLVGNFWYGLQKVEASFDESSTSFEVFDSIADPLFGLTVSQSGSWIPMNTATGTLPNLADALNIFEMPVLGTLSWTPQPQRVCSYFEWHFDHTDVRPVVTEHKFVKAFAPGMEGWLNVGIPSIADGAFEVRNLSWLMRMPPQGCVY